MRVRSFLDIAQQDLQKKKPFPGDPCVHPTVPDPQTNFPVENFFSSTLFIFSYVIRLDFFDKMIGGSTDFVPHLVSPRIAVKRLYHTVF